jgi:signal transduction histidine kinase
MGGEIAALVRNREWSRTALGLQAGWPQLLKTAVSLCLSCPDPLIVWWGPDLVLFYNDAASTLLGRAHPAALGRKGRECWPEIWPLVGPLLETVLSRGEAQRAEDLLLLVDRGGRREEKHFSFSLSPIRDENGRIGGVFTQLAEATAKIVEARRRQTLCELAIAVGQPRDADAVCSEAAAVLAENPHDLPFALIYLAAPGGDDARLAAAAGIEPGTRASPREIALVGGAPAAVSNWPLTGLDGPADAERIDGLAARFGGLPGGAWETAPHTAMVFPIAPRRRAPPRAWFVAGISPFNRFDKDYRRFLDAIAAQLCAALCASPPLGCERDESWWDRSLAPADPGVVPCGTPLPTERGAVEIEMARLRARYREAMRSARAAEERLRAALAASGTGTYRWTICAETVESDAALDRLFGFPDSEGAIRRSQDFVARVHPDDCPRVIAQFEKCGREGIDCDTEFRVVWPDATVRWLYNRGKTFVDAAGRPIHIAGACVDITERKRVEDALRELNETLERKIGERTRALEAEMAERRRVEAALQQAQRLEVVGQVTGGIAHDFNNLLMIIGGNLELLKLRRGDPERVTLRLEEAVARGESLTRQLLSFSRRQAVQPQVIDLAAWAPRLLELLRPSLRGDIDLVSELAADIWPIEVDPGELELALLNIAVNARDAMPRGGRLTISLRNKPVSASPEGGLSGDFVHIAVSDTGTGIPADLVDKVFEPFFTTKEVGKGTGLGLSQVHGFARQAGGTAFVESREGAGTTVSLLLPRSAAPPVTPETEQGGTVGDRASGTILLVEDNDDVAEVTSGMLEGLGYAVVRAALARQALGYLEEGARPDLLLSDIVMPGDMSGLDLARHVRAHYPDLPILLSTGYSAAAREAADEGLAILLKPYRMAALEHFIRTVLDRARRSRR